MKNEPSGTGKPRIPFAPQPEYDVVWSGKALLIPVTDTASSSTWHATVNKLRAQLDGANRRQINGEK
jgi:hypothetical protein